MTRRTGFVIAATAMVVAVVAAGVLLARDGEGAQPVARAGDVVDEAGGGDPVELAGTDPITGEAVALADFAGEPVVLNFWASWCAPCRAELPALASFAEAHPEAAVVGVNFQDNAADAAALHAEIGWDFPSIADPRGDLGAQLGLQGMPTTYFLDESHRVVGLVAGETTLDGFEQGLELATGGG